mgnify:CR=1 FL=1
MHVGCIRANIKKKYIVSECGGDFIERMLVGARANPASLWELRR